MIELKLKGLWQNGEWKKNTLIKLQEDGLVSEVTTHNEETVDFMVPSLTNAHSHAFQWSMAGMAEIREKPDDDFWSWRQTMYNVANNLSENDFYNIAAFLYANLRAHGYGSVTEFHYLHGNGTHNQDLNRCDVLAQAASDAGIQISIIPIFYHFGDFGRQASQQQKIFCFDSAESYLKSVQSLRSRVESNNCIVGTGIHSLRAASETQIALIAKEADSSRPFHIHISEQTKEVQDCINFYGERPTAWFLKRFGGINNLNLVHATHVNDEELKLIVENDASVVLCPSTEANLGDGFFPLDRFQELNGRWSIGSDSHIQINPFEDLRWLEYGLRLQNRKRMRLVDQNGDNASYLYQSALKGGEQAHAGFFQDEIKPGNYLQGTLIDGKQANMLGKSLEYVLPSMIFSGHKDLIKEQFVRGKPLDSIIFKKLEQQYHSSLNQLFNQKD